MTDALLTYVKAINEGKEMIPPKELPILFSGPMVRATLEGRKTMTRRVVKPQPKYAEHPFQVSGDQSMNWYQSNPDYPRHGNMMSYTWKCPYGQPGDRLWVRETWTTKDEIWDDDKAEAFMVNAAVDPSMLIYRADGEVKRRWRPSIFMPRWASRINLEVVNVRVERLLEITTRDIIREGYPVPKMPEISESEKEIIRNCCAADLAIATHPATQLLSITPPKEWFCNLWESINGPGSWEANPWVWVIEFRKIQ